MIVRSVAITLIIGASIPVLAQAATCPTVNELRSEIKRSGAKATLDASYANSERWNCILEGIESATSAWLSIASILYSESDAGTSSELGDSVVSAFEKRPTSVLAVVQEKAAPQRLSVQTVCNPALEPRKGYRAFFNRMEKRLTMLDKAGLSRKKELCLTIVRRARLALSDPSK